MIPEEEKQDIQLHFRVTRREKEIIDQKMTQMGTKRLGVYLRKMAIDGYVVKLDLPEVRKLVSLLRYAGNNLNQLTVLANMGRVSVANLSETAQALKTISETLREITERGRWTK